MNESEKHAIVKFNRLYPIMFWSKLPVVKRVAIPPDGCRYCSLL